MPPTLACRRLHAVLFVLSMHVAEQPATQEYVSAQRKKQNMHKLSSNVSFHKNSGVRLVCAAAADEVIDKIRSYQKLIDDYLLYFFERTNSTKKNRVMTSMPSLSAWGSSPKKKKETPKEKMKKAHGLTFIALITELWINTYVPFESPHECHVTWIDLEKKGTLGVIAAPSDKLLLCLLDVVNEAHFLPMHACPACVEFEEQKGDAAPQKPAPPDRFVRM